MLWTNSSRKQPRDALLRSAVLPAFALAGTLLFPCQTAWAAGTLAGTNIENIATASYDTGSGTIDIQSNTAVILVDELLDVTVASTDPGDVPTVPVLLAYLPPAPCPAQGVGGPEHDRGSAT